MNDKIIERETKKQVVYHEVGHVFGLPNKNRGHKLEHNLGVHCTNNCAMKQGLSVPHDWIKQVYERQNTGQVYCNPCLRDLRLFFGK